MPHKMDDENDANPQLALDEINHWYVIVMNNFPSHRIIIALESSNHKYSDDILTFPLR
jgi:hypothetical protein